MNGERNLFDEQMARITQVIGAHTQVGLARLLGISKSSVSDAKRRGIIPVKWLDTLQHLKNVNPDWIERQLAHSERDGVRAAYNYAAYLPERRKMMQGYADYLTALKEKR